MKSKKALNDFGSVMKLAIKDNWLIVGLLTVLSSVAGAYTIFTSNALAMYFSSFLEVSSEAVGNLYKYFEMNYGRIENTFFGTLVNTNFFIFLGMTFCSFFVVLKNFLFLYDKRKSDLMFALPVKRTSTFVAKAVCCFASVFCCLCCAVGGCCNAWECGKKSRNVTGFHPACESRV